MTDPSDAEVEHFRLTPAQVPQFEIDYEMLEVRLLVHTFPWWKRTVVRCLWKTPMRRFLRRRFLNPYGTLAVDARKRSEEDPVDEPRADR